jgi:hypothetical protein
VAWFRNFYKCDGCDEKWAAEWSCKVDDDCPYCGERHMVPYLADDLTYLVVERENVHVVLHSPESAEDSPDFEEVAEFLTREMAEAYVATALQSLAVHLPEPG